MLPRTVNSADSAAAPRRKFIKDPQQQQLQQQKKPTIDDLLREKEFLMNLLQQAKADREASKLALEEKDKIIKEKDIEIAKLVHRTVAEETAFRDTLTEERLNFENKLIMRDTKIKKRDLLVKDFLEILATSEIFSSGEASGTSDIILRAVKLTPSSRIAVENVCRKYLIVLEGSGEASRANQHRLNAVRLLNKINNTFAKTAEEGSGRKTATKSKKKKVKQEAPGSYSALSSAEYYEKLIPEDHNGSHNIDDDNDEDIDGDGSHYSGILGESTSDNVAQGGDQSAALISTGELRSPTYVRSMARGVQDNLGVRSSQLGKLDDEFVSLSISYTDGSASRQQDNEMISISLSSAGKSLTAYPDTALKGNSVQHPEVKEIADNDLFMLSKSYSDLDKNDPSSSMLPPKPKKNSHRKIVDKKSNKQEENQNNTSDFWWNNLDK